MLMENKIKVLVIEDQCDIRESTCEILELAGFETYQASNGKIGVEIAQKSLPEVILCDILMPELDGFGVLYMLSKKPETSSIPFIFLTAKTEHSTLRKGMEMGADDFLTKPFDGIELLNAIESRLKKRNQQKVLDRSGDQLGKLNSTKCGLDVLEKLIGERKVRHIKRKQVIYYAGDNPMGIYLVLSGHVKTFKIADDGRELLTGLYRPNEYFGLVDFLLAEDYKENAEATEEVTICLLPKNKVDDLIWKHPDVAASFIKILANHINSTEEQLLQLAYHSVRKRMAELLIRLKIKGGSLDLGMLNLSRDNLAGMAGIATETVSRILGDFKEEGLISGTSNQIIILNVEKLEKMRN